MQRAKLLMSLRIVALQANSKGTASSKALQSQAEVRPSPPIPTLLIFACPE